MRPCNARIIAVVSPTANTTNGSPLQQTLPWQARTAQMLIIGVSCSLHSMHMPYGCQLCRMQAGAHLIQALHLVKKARKTQLYHV